MEIKFECSGCGQRISVDSTGAGQTAVCPGCQVTLTVPENDVVARIAAITDTSAGWLDTPTERHLRPDFEDSTLRKELLDATHNRARLECDLAAAQMEAGELRSRIVRIEEERDLISGSLEQLRSERHEVENAYAELQQHAEKQQQEVASRAESYRKLEERLAESEEERALLTQELISLKEKAEKLIKRASLVDLLQAEVGNLQRDIALSSDAQECKRLRIRAEKAEESHQIQQRELENAKAEGERLLKAEAELRRELAASNERCSAEARKVEELSDGKAQRDNSVLRSVLGRQKVELEICYRDLKRFRRAQIGLRLTYALFALGLIGVVAFALQALPEVADFLETL